MPGKILGEFGRIRIGRIEYVALDNGPASPDECDQFVVGEV
jgi:hypothetical protein